MFTLETVSSSTQAWAIHDYTSAMNKKNINISILKKKYPYL